MPTLSELYDEIICIQKTVNKIKEDIDKLKMKRFLKVGECLPPPSICKDILAVSSAGNLINNFDEIIYILANYYGCKKMGLYVNPEKCSSKALATYYPSEGNAYTHEKTLDIHSFLHEWFHHIHGCEVLFLTDEQKINEEKYANAYADNIIKRGMIK